MSKSSFRPPAGVNYHCSKDISITELSRALSAVCAFLQTLDPSVQLLKYEDWWEHDGLHLDRGSTNLRELFSLVETPRALLESMPGDDLVFIAFAPADAAWYLRFYVNWDAEGRELLGRFDLTLPGSASEVFAGTVPNKIDLAMERQDAEDYFKFVPKNQ